MSTMVSPELHRDGYIAHWALSLTAETPSASAQGVEIKGKKKFHSGQVSVYPVGST